jgi:GNAT superfamily N-acetyltransferase
MGQAAPPGGIFRRLGAADVALFREHLIRLDPDTRRDRFAMGASDSFLARYAEQAFAGDAVLFGFVEAGRLRAVAELRPFDSREAEAAFSIERDFRRRGLATELFSRLITAARNRRLRRLYMNCLAHNRAMQGLARKFSAELTFESDSVLAIVTAPPGSPASVMQEAGDAMGVFTTAILQLQGRWLGLTPFRR